MLLTVWFLKNFHLCCFDTRPLSGDKVSTKVVNDAKPEILLPVIVRKIAPDSLVQADCYRSYSALDVSDFYHQRITHSALFARRNITLMVL